MMKLSEMEDRSELGTYLNSNGLVNVGAEVGVFIGDNAKTILHQSDLKLLYLVDLWHDQSIYERCVSSLSPYGSRACYVRKDSVLASTLFDDASLDFVYIDADHEYEPFKRDIEAWYPKVRSGGLFSGHDYGISEQGEKTPLSVALDEWLEKAGLGIHTTKCSSWWLMKL